ncbi:MAG: hypothetical protein JJ895_11325 [Balneolaceae bacterium]|nr:hypothetical protein [Balneolaceae bacterium]
MTGVEILGWLGFGLLITAWVPQTWDTIKAGRTDMNMIFILLYVTSSLLLTIYSVLTVDYVFITLNALLTFGSGINLFYKIKPRKADG